MKLLDKQLSLEKIKILQEKYGDYVKITADVENGWIAAGCELHADGEKILLEKGSKQDNIWGGGINLADKTIDTAAVLNFRPNKGNNSMEILDSGIRERFIKLVKKFIS